MNRGSEQVELARPPATEASMRPRFMNRGSAIEPIALHPQLAASMRPRFMNRGSSTFPVLCVAAPSCFNEAPIHESGK